MSNIHQLSGVTQSMTELSALSKESLVTQQNLKTALGTPSEEAKVKDSQIRGKIFSGVVRALGGVGMVLALPAMFLSPVCGLVLFFTALPVDKLLTHLQNKLAESNNPNIAALSWIPATISIIPKAIVAILGSVAYLGALGAAPFLELAFKGEIKGRDSILDAKQVIDTVSNAAFEGIAKKIVLFIGLAQDLKPEPMATRLLDSMLVISYGVKADGMRTIFNELDRRIRYSHKMGDTKSVSKLVEIRAALIKKLDLHLKIPQDQPSKQAQSDAKDCLKDMKQLQIVFEENFKRRCCIT